MVTLEATRAESAVPIARILVVEDDAIVARDIAQLLQDAGYEPVGHAISGEMAIALTETLQPNLVLMDIQLRGKIDGIEAALAIRQRHALPVVFLTAYGNDETLARAKLSVPFGYILKPFSERDLRTVLEVALYKHQADARLRLSDVVLRAVSEGVIVTDAAQRIIATNSAHVAITGYSEAELVGSNCRRLQGALTDQRTIAAMRTALANDFEFAGEILNYRNDGTTFWNDLTISRVCDERGLTTHYVGITRDVTKRKRAEQENTQLQEQLQQALKMQSIGRLAGGVAHDFNNMLSVILGHTELALAKLTGDTTTQSNLQEIQKAAQRAANLTRQLLAFARKQTVAPTVLDLNEAVDGMLSMLPQLLGENIQIHWQPHAGLWPIEADPLQIDQLLTNLCVNARDAIADIGSLRIGTSNQRVDAEFAERHADALPGDYVCLTVRDTGCGMSAETQALMYEPFFTTKGIGKGTGLGLSMVHGAVAQNGGFITVQSALDVGTAFDIYFPRRRASEAQPPAGTPPIPNLDGRETILLVEDEPAILNLVTKVLEARGYEVLGASSPTDAINLASVHGASINLLLTDVIMPTMNGRDLADLLLADYPGMKHMFMSGYTADAISRHGMFDADVNFLQKPFSIQFLAERVRALLDSDVPQQKS